MDPVLTISNVEKSFGETRALDGAGFELRRGECLALLGPNGAGKTTLARAITGRVRLDAGELTLLGHPLNGSSGAEAARRRLGIVPQEIALYPVLTAEENLRAWGVFNGVPAAELKDRVRWALDWTGLDARAGDRVKGFSGGMKRRLNIACGVLHRPEVVVLDEPTVGVDPQSRGRIWEMLGELVNDGASLLLTTHQLDEAQQVCDRIVIIDNGTVIADGTFDELVDRTIGTARLVSLEIDGDIPPALVDGRFERDGDNGITCRVDEVAGELAGVLANAAAAGAAVTDVRIEAPSLQSVFIHLTGRELRE
jgi:ABC-2 type transport system ATP-binding protein